MVAISIEHLAYRYPNGHEALRDVSLEISAGTVMSLVGRNGSGKTTLAKHLNALLKPTAGKVRVLGFDTSESTASDMAWHVGFVFQNPEDQLFESTVHDEVAFGPRNLRMPREQVNARVKEALETVGLSGFLKEHPYNLTYGQRKMLCVASVLAMNPEIVILDEPNAGQDYFGTLLLGSIVEQLKKDGKTCVVISHDMEFVAKCSDSVAVLENGSIVTQGPPEKVLSDNAALKSSAIIPPQVTRLAAKLSQIGVRPDIVTVQEMLDELVQSVNRKR